MKSVSSFANFFFILVAGVVGLAGCTANPWTLKPGFPKEKKEWKIPLLNPLTQSGLFVIAEAKNNVKDASYSMKGVFYVDSGASSNVMSKGAIDLLKIKRRKNRNVLVRSADGSIHPWTGGVADEVQLGDLLLEDVAFLQAANTLIIGNNILEKFPWGVDYDAGCLVINPSEPPDASGIIKLPIHNPYQFGVDAIKVQIKGEDLFMILDTGATNTGIDDTFARELGLERKMLDKENEEVYQTAHRNVRVRALYKVKDFKPGGVSTGPQILRPLIDMKVGPIFNTKIAGLLGMDYLSRFAFRIDPGRSLTLTPRKSVLSTARARVSRWDWVEHCGDETACVSAMLGIQDEKSISAIITFSKAYEKPTSFLFACTDEDGALAKYMPMIEYRVSGKTDKGQHELFPVKTGDISFEDEISMKEAIEPCPQMKLIDVNPLFPMEEEEEGKTGILFHWGAVVERMYEDI